MNFKMALIVYLVSFLWYLILDLLWLRYLAGPYYQRKLDSILAEEPKLLPALIFYGLFVFGNLVFVVEPALAGDSLQPLLGRGVLYGLISYGTYDLTNHATLTEWPLSVTLLDLGWGVGVSLLTALAGFYTATYASHLL